MQRLLAVFLSLLCFTADAQQPIDVKHYRFELELTDRSDAITGKATITVAFVEDASRISFDLVSVDNDKGMYAFEVKEDGHAVRATHEQDKVMIDLEKPAKRGETHTIVISYMGTPKDGLIIAQNKWGDRTFFADNWPNRAHQWIPCIDRPDDKASFEFIVTAPDEYKVVSNGLMTEEKMLDAHRRRTSWNETTALSTKVMVIGAARFAVKQFSDSPPGIPVSAWVYPQDSVKGFYDYAVAPSIVKFFSNYIAPFPYRKLANVQSKTIFGGMENASAIFYAEASVTGNRKWEDVLAHEIAHQWFGDMASEKSFAHLWLSEGFATYFTNLYIENKYGRDSMLSRLRKDRNDIIDFAKTNKHAVVDSTEDLMSLLNVNSYQKGGWFLHMLHVRTGDSVFQKIIRRYYAQYKGGNAETMDLEKVAEEVSGDKGMREFFNEWLYRPGIPVLSFRTEALAKGGYAVTIRQEQKDLYSFSIVLGFGSVNEKPDITNCQIFNRETTFTFNPQPGSQLLIDPNVNLLFDHR